MELDISNPQIERLKKLKLTEFKNFLKQKMRDTQGTTEVLRTSPRAMQDLLEKKVTELKIDFKKQLTVTEQDTSSFVKEFDQQLQNAFDDFNREYQRQFDDAIWDLKEEKLEVFREYCEEQRSPHRWLGNMKIRPGLLRRDLENKVEEVLTDFGRSVDGNHPEKEQQMQEFEKTIKSEVDSFCRKYVKKYILNWVFFLLALVFNGANLYVLITVFMFGVDWVPLVVGIVTAGGWIASVWIPGLAVVIRRLFWMGFVLRLAFM